MQAAEGRVALVTGSSRGLGRAIARRLARDGLAVAVNGLRGDRQAAEVARTIRDEGGTAEVFTADVTDEQQVAGLVAAVTARLGLVDVLVLNATGPQPEAPLAEVAWEDHVAQLEFFVKSPVLLGAGPGAAVASLDTSAAGPGVGWAGPRGYGGPGGCWAWLQVWELV